MREILGVLFLMLIQGTGLLFAGIGSAFTCAGQMLHVTFLRNAARHDAKYAQVMAADVVKSAAPRLPESHVTRTDVN